MCHSVFGLVCAFIVQWGGRRKFAAPKFFGFVLKKYDVSEITGLFTKLTPANLSDSRFLIVTRLIPINNSVIGARNNGVQYTTIIRKLSLNFLIIYQQLIHIKYNNLSTLTNDFLCRILSVI